jgi:two-component system NtrC family response regulator
LLRVLETSEFIKLGETKTSKVDVRIIAATNRDLQNFVLEGKFREDLFYRLNVYSITLPPLRDRKKDIPVLAKFFVGLFAEKINVHEPAITPEFMEKLQQHQWKGNIRELKNSIERAVIVSNGEPLTVTHLRVLNHTRYNKAEAARLLNIGLATLYRKIEDYQLQ